MTQTAPASPPSKDPAARPFAHGAPDVHPIDLFLPEIRLLLAEKRLNELKQLLSEVNPIDLADGMSRLPPEQQLLALKLLRPDRLIKVFAELDIHEQEYVVQHLEDRTLAPLLADTEPDVAAQLFKKFPEKTVKKMQALMKKERVDVVRDILDFPPQTVGSIMNTDVISLSPDLTARGALDLLQARSRLSRGKIFDILYVCNEQRKLLGGFSLRTLISAPADIKAREIMSPVSIFRLHASWDREEAAKIFGRYKIVAAPVVDDQNRLLGILTADDVIQVIQQEATEDIQKLAGAEALDEPYFDIAFPRMVKKRATWLCVLFLGEMLTATAMAFFEKEIARALVLALFVPLIISSGGNSGSQAATLIVRAMALKEVSFDDWWRVMRREFAMGLVLGLILGTLGFLRIHLWSMVSDVYGPHATLVGATVGASLVLVVLWGSLAGSLLPMALRRAGLDPAVASAPFVATLVDVTGLLIYFSIGLLILRGTLL